jgi:RNA polymerase sigma-54 factor
MKQGLSLRMSQHLALTPQLQQSIRMLQLSTLELQQEVEQMLDDNPFLEVSEADDAPDPEQPALDHLGKAELDAADAAPGDARPSTSEPMASAEATHSDAGEEQREFESLDWDTEAAPQSADPDTYADDWGASNRKSSDVDEGFGEDRRAVAGSLTDHLERQALSLRLDPSDAAALKVLIHSLDEDGYLADTLDEIAASLLGTDASAEDHEELVDRLHCALRWLQSFEPVGVGARNLGECLALQLQARAAGLSSPALQAALKIVGFHLDALARRDWRKLASSAGCTETVAKEAQALIASLEPKPARSFADAESQIVVPDVLVKQQGRGWVAVLNPDVMPRLSVNAMYANALKGGGRNGTAGNHAVLQGRLQEARWFVKNIQQRFDTILRVSNAIVERQKNFFNHGELAMRPLVLREIADELGLHESTISRVTTSKYMATRFGTFELKYFFGSALNTDAGGNASSTAVRALIKQLVAAESPQRPLSDNEIARLLGEQGIQCARRTVAKYREALRIAPANLRRAL